MTKEQLEALIEYISTIAARIVATNEENRLYEVFGLKKEEEDND